MIFSAAAMQCIFGRAFSSVTRNTARNSGLLKKSLRKWRGNVLKIRLMGTKNDIKWFERILQDVVLPPLSYPYATAFGCLGFAP